MREKYCEKSGDGRFRFSIKLTNKEKGGWNRKGAGQKGNDYRWENQSPDNFSNNSDQDWKKRVQYVSRTPLKFPDAKWRPSVM